MSKKFWLIVQDHNSIQEGGIRKCHIAEEDSDKCLCGRGKGFDKAVFGSEMQEVDIDYLYMNPMNILMKEVCVKCLKKALDLLEEEENKK